MRRRGGIRIRPFSLCPHRKILLSLHRKLQNRRITPPPHRNIVSSENRKPQTPPLPPTRPTTLPPLRKNITPRKRNLPLTARTCRLIRPMCRLTAPSCRLIRPSCQRLRPSCRRCFFPRGGAYGKKKRQCRLCARLNAAGWADRRRSALPLLWRQKKSAVLCAGITACVCRGARVAYSLEFAARRAFLSAALRIQMPRQWVSTSSRVRSSQRAAAWAKSSDVP